jgi:hypothetical protein
VPGLLLCAFHGFWIRYATWQFRHKSVWNRFEFIATTLISSRCLPLFKNLRLSKEGLYPIDFDAQKNHFL